MTITQGENNKEIDPIKVKQKFYHWKTIFEMKNSLKSRFEMEE